MKKKLSLLFLVLGLVLFFSCMDDDSQVEKVQGSKVSSFIVSPDSAIAISNQAIRAISENSETRSSQSKRQVNSVKLVNLASNMATRSQNENAISSSLYIINYKDNKGFAIVSSDKRLRPLYAISDTGNIAISDTITNKSLALFFHGVESDMGSVTSDTLLLRNSGGKTSVVNPQVSPIIWRAPRQWGQGEPYNTYCFTKSGEKAKVGCVAVACGIVMTFYDWPVYINDKHIGWHGMKKYTFDHDIDYVFGKLGEPKQLDMSYGVSSSGAYMENVSRTFVRMGYYAPDKLQDFSEKAICNWLSDRFQTGHGPVIVCGKNMSRNSRHAWVIDGYCTNVVDAENSSIQYNTVLFHCIWGWDGDNNGYFYLNNGQLGGSASLFAGGDNGNQATNKYKDLQYIANFRINRDKERVNL